jgi:hypothetical protein
MTDIINIQTRQPAVTPATSNPKRSRRKTCATVKPCDIGDIVDQLCDIKTLATGGVDACFGIEHLSDVSCDGPRAIFEAISRLIAEIQAHTEKLANRMGVAVQS